MKFIVCPDSFKGSLTSQEACNIIGDVILQNIPNAEVVKIPLSDGGEGFCDIYTKLIGGKIEYVEVLNALGIKTPAKIGIKDNLAVIESAEVCGLAQIQNLAHNPMITTSYGVGQLIKYALDKQCNKIIIGLGGSATNDCGIGMLSALGAKFYNENSNTIDIPIGQNLGCISKADFATLDNRLSNVEIVVASDVKNQLLGINGATHVFARQKGASDDDVTQLEQFMQKYVKYLNMDPKIDLNNIVGGGAAGGLGASLVGVLNARITSGIDLILNNIGFDDLLSDCDYVISGEGKVDSQTLNGKVISGLANYSKNKNVPLIVLCGSVNDDDIDFLYESGVTAIFPIVRCVSNLSDAIDQAKDNLRYTVDNILRLLDKK